VPSIPPPDGRIELRDGGFRHLVRVRRLGTGSAVELFDGNGHSASAVLDGVTRDSAFLRVLAIDDHERRLPLIHLASALPKGDRLGTLIDMATQLGMDRFTPLACERSVVRWSPGSARRAGQIAIEAARQSGRAWLPGFNDEVTPTALLDRLGGADILVCAANGEPVKCLAAEPDRSGRGEVALVVGPEGGFSPAEERLFEDHDLSTLALSDGILRIETAAIMAVALARRHFRDPGRSNQGVATGSAR
jgi:16S rRNA (uracil1498-N3)-methyltransferase